MSVQIKLENMYHENIISELKREEEINWENIRHGRQIKHISKREEELER
ncbi:hypothetical protein [Clostridium sporogenes]|nr:hypothetical protein [Clostridium sporogenes]